MAGCKTPEDEIRNRRNEDVDDVLSQLGHSRLVDEEIEWPRLSGWMV